MKSLSAKLASFKMMIRFLEYKFAHILLRGPQFRGPNHLSEIFITDFFGVLTGPVASY